MKIMKILPTNIRYKLSSIKSAFIYGGITKGKNCYIDKSAEIIGKSHVKLGNNVGIGMNTFININALHKDTGIYLDIGSSSFVGRGTFISVGKKVTIGDYFLGGPYLNIMCSNHNIDDPINSYITGSCSLDKEVIIEDNVWIGAHVTILGNVTIGRGSIIGAGTLITKDVPPFSIVYGNPCRISKRFSFKEKKWISGDDIHEDYPSIEDYKRLLYERNGNIELPVFALTNRYGDL